MGNNNIDNIININIGITISNFVFILCDFIKHPIAKSISKIISTIIDICIVYLNKLNNIFVAIL